MQQVKAKKALGQHFLTDLSIAERIADSISSHAHLPVLEIGPGMGVLTQFLLEKGYDTHVIEIDTESVAYLKEHFPALEGRIIEGDFLKIPIEDYFPGDAPFALIGNYPYNISSQIFFRMLDYRERIPCCAGMLQREVAQRLASPPGNKDYGILSVLLQAWYDVEYLFTVDEHVFNPPPQGQERSHPPHPQRAHRPRLLRSPLQAGHQDGVQPATQDPAQLPQGALRSRLHGLHGRDLLQAT